MDAPELFALYGQVLTVKQREAYELHARRMSDRAIALALGVSRSTVRSRLEEAHRKLVAAHRSKEAA